MKLKVSSDGELAVLIRILCHNNYSVKVSYGLNAVKEGQSYGYYTYCVEILEEE